MLGERAETRAVEEAGWIASRLEFDESRDCNEQTSWMLVALCWQS